MISLKRRFLGLTFLLMFPAKPATLAFANCLSKDSATKAAQIVDQTLSDPRYHIPGISLSIISRCGDEFNYSSGTAVLGQKIPLSQSTHFRVGSVTKAFTAYLTMLLTQAGYFSTESTLGSILPELRSELPRIDVEHITIRNLLNHTSGIPTYATLNQGIYQQVLEHPLRIWPAGEVLTAISANQG